MLIPLYKTSRHLQLRISDGRLGLSRIGSGRVGSRRIGSGRVEPGRVGSGQVRPGRVGSGRFGSDRVGSDRVGPGRAGSGQVRSGRVGSGAPQIIALCSRPLAAACSCYSRTSPRGRLDATRVCVKRRKQP